MITRNSILTCPSCGHEGKPEHKNPIGARSELELLMPHVMLAAETARTVTGTLHCEKCGHQFTEAPYKVAGGIAAEAAKKLADKAQQIKGSQGSQVDRLKGFFKK